jgi:hypothetical protein
LSSLLISRRPFVALPRLMGIRPGPHRSETDAS